MARIEIKSEITGTVWQLKAKPGDKVEKGQILADGAATLRVRFKTQPLNQGKVANELRRRLLGAFTARGIKPYA